VAQDLIRSGALVALRTELPRLRRRFLLVLHARKQRTRGLNRLIEYLAASGGAA
jgi:hypothetical protein